jgi:hypothetical protein
MNYKCEYCGIETKLYYNFRNHLITKTHIKISELNTDINQLDINRTLVKELIKKDTNLSNYLPKQR